ncbi:MAG: hypothetical protein LBC94_00475 [Desulfovibrio sp.]|jgi:hypothetical protein|nr:hypothetical protein [Desulfovibrio sp.]
MPEDKLFFACPVKNVVLVFILACALCACGGGGGPLLPYVPQVETPSFPDVRPDYQAGGYALECEHGFYTGRHIEQSDLFKRTSGTEAFPDPQGKGKIHIRHAMWQDLGLLGIWPERWGFTFTVHTTDDGIITKCSATQQLLQGQ